MKRKITALILYFILCYAVFNPVYSFGSSVINDISKIEGNNYWVMGEYHLKRAIGNANGVFIIIFKKINGEWKIVADMSC